MRKSAMEANALLDEHSNQMIGGARRRRSMGGAMIAGAVRYGAAAKRESQFAPLTRFMSQTIKAFVDQELILMGIPIKGKAATDAKIAVLNNMIQAGGNGFPVSSLQAYLSKVVQGKNLAQKYCPQGQEYFQPMGLPIAPVPEFYPAVATGTGRGRRMVNPYFR